MQLYFNETVLNVQTLKFVSLQLLLVESIVIVTLDTQLHTRIT